MNAFEFRRAISALIGCALLGAGAAAAPAADDEPACALRIATGPAGKVYERAFADIRSVCGAEQPLCQVASEGGLQNLGLLAANQADLGMVQQDTLDTMKRGGDDALATLQAVLPLHANLLHIVALESGSTVEVRHLMGVAVPHTGRSIVVKRFSQLRGLRVAAVGSAQLMARTINQQTGYAMTLDDVDTDDQALALLRAGEVQAIFTLGGWPTPLIARLHADSGLMLAEFDIGAQAPYRIVKRSYQNLAAYNLPFLAVPNLLVTRAFKPAGPYGRRVADLQRCILRHLDELQEGNYSPVWKEIKEPADLLGEPAFRAAPERAEAARRQSNERSTR